METLDYPSKRPRLLHQLPSLGSQASCFSLQCWPSVVYPPAAPSCPLPPSPVAAAVPAKATPPPPSHSPFACEPGSAAAAAAAECPGHCPPTWGQPCKPAAPQAPPQVWGPACRELSPAPPAGLLTHAALGTLSATASLVASLATRLDGCEAAAGVAAPQLAALQRALGKLGITVSLLHSNWRAATTSHHHQLRLLWALQQLSSHSRGPPAHLLPAASATSNTHPSQAEQPHSGSEGDSGVAAGAAGATAGSALSLVVGALAEVQAQQVVMGRDLEAERGRRQALEGRLAAVEQALALALQPRS